MNSGDQGWYSLFKGRLVHDGSRAKEVYPRLEETGVEKLKLGVVFRMWAKKARFSPSCRGFPRWLWIGGKNEALSSSSRV